MMSPAPNADVDDDDTLVARFEDCSLPGEALTHRNHVRIAWLYLRDATLEAAALRFCTNLRRYADAQGKSRLFHATITWAYLALINERRQDRPAGETFDAFAAAHADLLDQKQGALAQYYDREVLESPLARRAFLLPRGRLPLSRD